MDNHYHLIIETPEANLSKGMRQLNGIYTQKYNWKYKKTGHVFQGRYKAIIVDKESYLLELCRYVVLNPLRAGMVEDPKDWQWSNYLSTVGIKNPPEWLTIDWVLGQFYRTRKRAIEAYKRFIMEGVTEGSPWKDLSGQIFLGDALFIEKAKRAIRKTKDLKGIPRSQRFIGRPRLEELLTHSNDKSLRNKTIYRAHVEYSYTLKEIAEYLNVHYTTVSKIVKSVEGR
jgi:putative transposase